MNIVKATTDDQEYIAHANDSILAHHHSFDPFYEPVDGKQASDVKREQVAFVAEKEGERVGFISGVITRHPVDRSEPFAAIHAIWVESDNRGAGVACQLVREFEQFVRDEQVFRVELSVDVRNALGKALWDVHNYTVYQERRYKVLTPE